MLKKNEMTLPERGWMQLREFRYSATHTGGKDVMRQSVSCSFWLDVAQRHHYLSLTVSSSDRLQGRYTLLSPSACLFVEVKIRGYSNLIKMERYCATRSYFGFSAQIMLWALWFYPQIIHRIFQRCRIMLSIITEWAFPGGDGGYIQALVTLLPHLMKTS